MIIKTNEFYTYSSMKDAVNALSNKYPFLKQGIIGYSVMNKTIPYIRIGSGSKKVVYVASTHANEGITTSVLLKFIEDYSLAYANGKEIFNKNAKELFDEVSIYLIPMLNPDGIELVYGNFPKSSEYYLNAVGISENFPNISFPSGWKANILGIDLNLQFPAGWEEAKKIKFKQGYTKPAPRDYVGSMPLEVPESISIYDFIISLQPELLLTYHSQGNVIYYKYLDFDPPNATKIGRKLAKISGYSLQETPTVSGYAGLKDWFIYEFNKPGYTIEVGSGKNPLPITDFDEIYKRNIGILVTAAIET